MKQFLKLVSLLLLSITSMAQPVELGEASLSFSKPKLLMRSESLFDAVRSPMYLDKVGGVAFDKVAVPAGGQAISSLQIRYSPSETDGRRFSVVINGQTATTALYDWELVPIAKYANSIHTACFTLFGDLEDSYETCKHKENGDRILNYHPELSNTLLGLRLFELDLLVIEPTLSIHLPKDERQNYILGKGERGPDVPANRLGYNRYRSAFERIDQDYRSYLVCDQNRTITFGLQNGSFHLTGQPFYYFWQFNTDLPAYKQNVGRAVGNEVDRIMSFKKTQTEKLEAAQSWLRERLSSEAIQLDPTCAWSRTKQLDEDLNALRLFKSNEEYIQIMQQLLVEARIENAPHKRILYLEELSTNLSNQPQLFRDINPAVWDAAVKTMQYSAFFRYCKKKFPDEWKAFMTQMKRVTIEPAVTTPTVLHKKPKR